jgi:hypothetical protein
VTRLKAKDGTEWVRLEDGAAVRTYWREDIPGGYASNWLDLLQDLGPLTDATQECTP